MTWVAWVLMRSSAESVVRREQRPAGAAAGASTLWDEAGRSGGLSGSSEARSSPTLLSSDWRSCENEAGGILDPVGRRWWWWSEGRSGRLDIPQRRDLAGVLFGRVGARAEEGVEGASSEHCVSEEGSTGLHEIQVFRDTAASVLDSTFCATFTHGYFDTR